MSINIKTRKHKRLTTFTFPLCVYCQIGEPKKKVLSYSYIQAMRKEFIKHLTLSATTYLLQPSRYTYPSSNGNGGGGGSGIVGDGESPSPSVVSI